MQEYHSAVRLLCAVLDDGRSLDASFKPGDSPLAKQITYGVIRHYYELEGLLSLLLNKPLTRKNRDLHVLLLAGLYSVEHLNRPAHASVNALVEATVGLKKKWAKNLINGVLRHYLRNQASLLAQLSDEEMRSNHPTWLLNRIREAYADSQEIIDANNSQAPMTLRVNLSRITRHDYQTRLLDQGLKSDPGKLADAAVYLKDPVQVSELPGFKEGLVSVQDEASQLAAGVLNLLPRLTLLDACAAPGGKTCHILETEPSISLTALDKDEHRINLVRENLSRLNLNSQLVAEKLEAFSSGKKYDRILLDAPCSATGIIRRHPDIKLLRRDADIDKLAATQLALLEKAWVLLKDNGELVYSTCSILPTENDDVIGTFVEANATARVSLIDVDWGHATSFGRQLLPGKQGCDGFFYSRLKKQNK